MISTVDDLPKRIILSRKGTDGGAGGFPSLIVDDKLLSIPIPEPEFEHDRKYADVLLPTGPWRSSFANFGGLVEKISQRRKSPVCKGTTVHLDPDIRRSLLPEAKRGKWRAAFGQCCVADGELKLVEEGDLFLFFGWFNKACIDDATVTPLKKEDRKDQHVIWGWLQVGDVRRNVLPSLDPSHVHEYPRKGDQRHKGNNNSIYYASEYLSFRPAIRGHGVFTDYEERLCLTHPACRQGCRSLWRLPYFFAGALTGIGNDPWITNGDSSTVQAVGQHQEYLFEVPERPKIREGVRNWLTSLPFPDIRTKKPR